MRGATTQLGGPDDTEITAEATDLATFTVILVSRATASLARGVDGAATRLSNAHTVLRCLTEAGGILAVTRE